jgi:hypothetical protein
MSVSETTEARGRRRPRFGLVNLDTGEINGIQSALVPATG